MIYSQGPVSPYRGHERGDERDGKQRDLLELVQVQLCACEREEDDVDWKRQPLHGFDQSVSGLREVRDTETGCQKHQDRIPLELVRNERDEVDHTDDEHQKLLIDVLMSEWYILLTL